MNRALALAAASVLALSAAGASATNLPVRAFTGGFHPFRMPKRARFLYNQNSNYASDAISSQNFTSSEFTGYDDQGADDFVVPPKTTWTVTGVDVSGQTSEGGEPASEDVIFYANSRFDDPGKPIEGGTFTALRGRFDNGNIAIGLPGKGLKLKPGAYWVSVVANMNFELFGQWYWDVSSVQHGYQAMWRNPEVGGLGCWETWSTIESCVGATGPDFMFDLRGTSRRKL